jgi:hypothetical protein
MIRRAHCRSKRWRIASALLAVIVAGRGLAGCTTGMEAPAEPEG